MRFFSAVFPGKSPAPALATQATRRWPLDLPLIKFSRPNDIWRLSDAFQDVLIIGAKGSGKTSGSGKVFASKYLQAGFGGLVLCAQIEEANLWRERLKQAGRVGDGRFFSLGSAHERENKAR